MVSELVIAAAHHAFMAKAPPPPQAQTPAEQQKIIRDWLDDIRRKFGVEIPTIATKASPPMSPATLYRWIDPDYQFKPSESKIRAISTAWNVPLPALDAFRTEPGVSEASQEELEQADRFEGVVPGPQQGCWRIWSRALELAGYMPGDVVLADATVKPVRGDVVVVQIIDLTNGQARTRLRLYQPPYVVVATMDPKVSEQPLFVDDERVAIWGTVIRTVRIRSAVA